MLKKTMVLIFFIFSICLADSPVVFSDETLTRSEEMKYKYLYLFNGISSLKSMSAQYFSHIYPDTFYVGPAYAQPAFHKANMYIKTDMNTDILLIDLKWQLDGDWFWGIYSELEHSYSDPGNTVYQQIKNPLDADIGILFIHKF